MVCVFIIYLEYCTANQLKNQCIPINQIMSNCKSLPSTTESCLPGQVYSRVLVAIFIYQCHNFITLWEVLLAELDLKTLLPKLDRVITSSHLLLNQIDCSYIVTQYEAAHCNQKHEAVRCPITHILVYNFEPDRISINKSKLVLQLVMEQYI